MKLFGWARKPEHKNFYLKPKDDITAKELALLMPFLLNSRDISPKFFKLMIEELPENVKRHIEFEY